MKVNYLFVVLILSLSACKNQASEQAVVRSESELLELIHAWSSTDSLKNPEIQKKYTLALEEFLANYPDNPEHENFLFLSASNSVNHKDFANAADKYARFSEKYPKSRSHADALFAAGFLYNNELGNLDSARKYYELFILTYPDHMLVEAAQSELLHLGKSPEEMLDDITEGRDTFGPKRR